MVDLKILIKTVDGVSLMEESMDGQLKKLKLDTVKIPITPTGLPVMDNVLNSILLKTKDTLKSSTFPKRDSPISMSR